jgi:acyl-CoA hydrolase
MADDAFEAILDSLAAGSTVYVPGGSGESRGLCAALARQPHRAAGVHFVSCLIPGINTFDYANLCASATLTTFLLPPELRQSFQAGRVRVPPLTYTQIAELLAGRLTLDVAVAHVSPSDLAGRCSLGIAADFSAIAWRHARRRIAIVNRSMPAMPRGAGILLSEADVIVEVEDPLAAAERSASSATTVVIAERVSGLVPDGATIQIGIGGVPETVWSLLLDHRDLSVHSGIVTHGIIGLSKAGALRHHGSHCTGIAFGDVKFYRELSQSDLVAFASVPETHGPETLAALDRFTAINSAFEVDLFGQANLEWHSGRLMSGVGGAPDFARGAMRSSGGRSIIALPATAQRGVVSRIVPHLACPAVSLARQDVDTIVTEHGIAELRGLPLDERATAMIKIADPVHRLNLAKAWRRIRKKL